jgi:hypothetical protein
MGTFSALSSKLDRILVSLLHFACSRQVFWLHRPTSGLPTAKSSAAVTILLLIGFPVRCKGQGGVTAAGPLPFFTEFPIIARQNMALGDRLQGIRLQFCLGITSFFFAIIDRLTDS